MLVNNIIKKQLKNQFHQNPTIIEHLLIRDKSLADAACVRSQIPLDLDNINVSSILRLNNNEQIADSIFFFSIIKNKLHDIDKRTLMDVFLYCDDAKIILNNYIKFQEYLEYIHKTNSKKLEDVYFLRRSLDAGFINNFDMQLYKDLYFNAYLFLVLGKRESLGKFYKNYYYSHHTLEIETKVNLNLDKIFILRH